MIAGLSALLLFVLATVAGAWAQTGVLTQHNDTMRTGLNPNETTLTTTNVTVNQFGKVFTLPVTGQVYAQPLYVQNVTIGGVSHNVLIVATEADLVYAFDADSNTGANSAPLWTANLVDTAHGAASGNPLPETPLNAATTIACTDLQPQIGVTSTPTIGSINGVIYVYVEAKSINTKTSTYIHRLHALDITTGNEKSTGPTVITATVSGTGDGSSSGHLTFDSLHQMNRTGLLLLNGTVYVGFASHCDYGPYHGWLYAYDADSLAQQSVFVSDPNGGLGGFWMAGAGVAADESNDIFIPSGNGTFDTGNAPVDFGDSILKLATTNGNLSLLDYFTPYDQATLSSGDKDLGSGGVMVLPDQPGTTPDLLVESGKDGTIFVINRDQMTKNNLHYCTTNCNNGDPEILEESAAGFVGGMFSVPAYWNSTLYFWGKSDGLKAIPVTSGLPDFTHITGTTQTIAFPGATPSISSNGTASGTAIVWAIDSSKYGSPGPGPGPAVLYAFDATNLSKLLWSSAQASNNRDQAGNAVKFSVPTIMNGKVYVGTSAEVDVYGLLSPPLPTPQITPGSETFTSSVPVSISDTNGTAAIYYTTDGSTPVPGSGTAQLYGSSFNVTASTVVNAVASLSGFANSVVASATFTLQPEATPQINPGSETFAGTLPVTITDGTGGAAIYYTTDGSTPAPGVGTTQLYGSGISVTGTTTVKAIAAATGYANSAVASVTYTLQTAATPQISPGAETFTGTLPVTITDGTGGAAIYYTTDGSTPAPGVGTTQQYGSGINVTGTTTVKAIAAATGYANSAVASVTYTLQTVATPQINPGAETFAGTLPVTITDGTGGAAIYYTTDGSTPAPGVGTTQQYGSGISVTATSTVKALAVAAGYANSAVASVTYTLQGVVPVGPTIRVRAGTTSTYTDPTGNVWSADAYFSGGTQATPVTHAITNTTTQPLYQTERYNGFTYTFTGLPVGATYAVTLKFAEDYWTAAGKRIFSVVVNGTTVLTNFDIFADSGGEFIADDKTYSATVNSSGQIVIQFQNGSVDYAKIDAMQLVPTAPAAATPQISPGTETFAGTLPVTITDGTGGAAIYYTTDGSTPAPGVGTTQLYGSGISVTGTTTVKAIAAATGYANSAVASVTYTSQSAIAIDATASTDKTTASTTVASAAFSTTHTNELLLAFVSAAGSTSGANTTVTGVSGAGLTWTLVLRTNTQTGTAEIWRTFAAGALTNVTVTATLSKSVTSSITVMSFSGVPTSGTRGSGAIGATGTGNAATGAPTAKLTTTKTNSLVVGVGNDASSATGRTVGTSQTLIHQDTASAGNTYWVQRQTSVTPASGTSVTINDSAPPGDRYNLSICEILAGP